MSQLPNVRVCKNCGACLVGGYWKVHKLNSDGTRSDESELKDPRMLSARVCSLKVNATPERQENCMNPFKGSISPDSQFGFGNLDETELLKTMNFSRLLVGQKPLKTIFKPYNVELETFKLRVYFAAKRFLSYFGYDLN